MFLGCYFKSIYQFKQVDNILNAYNFAPVRTARRKHFVLSPVPGLWVGESLARIPVPTVLLMF